MAVVEPLSFLKSFINFELQTNPQYYANFRIDRVVELLRLVGNPQKKIKCFHIAGSKGKGSTCAFAAYILREAGYKVGLYTSPHLTDYKERIRILSPTEQPHQADFLSGQISEQELVSQIEKIKPAVEILQKENKFGVLTYFEVLTVLALCHFEESQVEFAVLETGLGGRLDATNAVDSCVCAITPISLEHTQLLGPTIKDIAQEKAAIIKSKEQVAVIAPQLNEAKVVLEARCRNVGAKSICVGKDIQSRVIEQTIQGQIFDIQGMRKYSYLKTRMPGEHQIINAAVAVGMIESLRHFGVNVGEDAIRKGIEGTFWPGRFEVIQEKPLVILDGAHNAASCEALVKTFREILPEKNVILVLSISQDKDIAAICARLNHIAGRIILTKTRHPRTIDWDKIEVAELFPGKKIFIAENTTQAMELALQKVSGNDVVLVAGSLFLVGEIRELCLKQV